MPNNDKFKGKKKDLIKIGLKQNIVKARELYQKAADQGDINAQYNLAFMYQKGQGGEKQLDKARELYQKTADKGNIDAIYQLGTIYYEQLDLWKAENMFQKAARKGHKHAINKLALYY